MITASPRSPLTPTLPGTARRRIAIVGGGVSGLTAAYALRHHHDVLLFEAETALGGHVRTVHLSTPDGPLAIDTGFIVFNEPNYPGFTALLRDLGLASQPSDMSFSVSCAATGIEYRGSDLNTLFARRRNLIAPGFLRMLGDIRRFNREARALLESGDVTTSMGDFVAERYSDGFIDHYLVPLGSSVWSADPRRFLDFPAAALARFFDRHGMLSLTGRPEWRTVTGGSDRYVAAIRNALAGPVVVGAPVIRVEREPDGVRLHVAGRGEVRVDDVILACHADQALRLLADPSPAEQGILSAFRYQPNRATLHTDARLLPTTPRAWASWNFRHITDRHHHWATERPTLTYHANRLQRLRTRTQYCTTLNQEEAIDPGTVIASFAFDHPIFDTRAMESQADHAQISGRRHTHYCGAYWGYGFHEDGVQSALRVVEAIPVGG